MENLDYDQLGFKAGFEIHQMLDSHKLFCECPSKLREKEPDAVIKRELRPTESELGEIDRAALAEAEKEKKFKYEVHPESVCLVELDEEPPHPLNKKARDIALESSLLLNATPVDEAHVMRKTVIDGSNTTGFQRTTLIATDGHIEVNGDKISIPSICLEEDAARKEEEGSEYVTYRLDRLGIPLLEIATGPDFNNPESLAKGAEKVGRILRATGKVKRGIGTIRQDVNVSIEEGARQEIKGVQELSLISKVAEREVQRQVRLLEIKEELESRNPPKPKEKIHDITDLFSESDSNLIQSAISDGGGVFAVKLEGFEGLLGKELIPDRRFGTELADYAGVYGKVGGIFHTDELPAYGITDQEVEKIREKLNAKDGDTVVIVADKKEKAEKGLKAVLRRSIKAFEGIPEETRRALPEGNTEYMRPLPGAARMYVETDVPPIKTSEEEIEEIKDNLPQKPGERREKYQKELGLSKELAKQMSLSENADLFEDISEEYEVDPTIVASTLGQTMNQLESEGISTEKITDESLMECFKLISEDKISKDALPQLLEEIGKDIDVKKAVEELGISKMEEENIESTIAGIVEEKEDLIDQRGPKAIDALMGHAMKELGGKADGSLVNEILEEKVKEKLS